MSFITSIDPHTILAVIYAFLAAFLPAMVWLYFWTREDTKNPEPKRMIAIAFIGGIIAVFVSLFLEKYFFGFDPKIILSNHYLQPILTFLTDVATQKDLALNKAALIIFFAPIIEELSKFILAYGLTLRTKADDEPEDPMIYMIITALGFSTIENMLFLIDPIVKNNIIFGIQTGNMRFIGATLLHTISSATIGIFISANFYSGKIHKFLMTVLSVILAIAIHSAFNYFMIGDVKSTFIALELIWVAVIIVLLAFEKIKKEQLDKNNLNNI